MQRERRSVKLRTPLPSELQTANCKLRTSNYNVQTNHKLQTDLYLCAMRKLSMAELNRKTVEDFRQADKHQIVVVLDNFRSMHNVGSVFRSADAFLINAIYL